MLKKLVEYLGQEVEIWTQENPEPWLGTLREVTNDYVLIQIDELDTFIASDKIVAFRMAEDHEHEEGGETEGESYS